MEEEVNVQQMFNEDTYEKAKVAKSYHSRGKHQRIPWNNYTKKELKKLNGEVTSYNLDRPMKWDEFKQMPDDLKRKYLLNLYDHGGTPCVIGKMMGVSVSAVSAVRRSLGMKPRKGVSPNYLKWEAWMNHAPETVDHIISEETERKIDTDLVPAVAALPDFRDTASGSFRLTCTCDELYAFLRESAGNGVREYLVTFQSVKRSTADEN